MTEIITLPFRGEVRLDAGNGNVLVVSRSVAGAFLLEAETAAGYPAIPVKLGNNVRRIKQSRRND